jgi:glycosyltransferase involved in cell wall biosynthesis
MPDTPLRVCLVAPLPPPYGGIAHWTQMVTGYAASRDDVVLDVVDIAPRWRDIDDLAVWKRVLFGGLQLLRDRARVRRALRTRPHALHLTTSGQLAIIRDIAVLAAARRAGVPAFYHLRFGRIPELAGGTSREWRLFTRAARLAHTVVAIDAATAAAIRAHLPGVRVVQVPNCVDLSDLPAPSLGAERTAVFLGWVVPTKGIEELVRAWAQVRPAGWRLQIIGPGNPEYGAGLLAAHRPEGVAFLGERHHAEAMQAVAQADLFVLPSYTEGFPNVIMEAMALGKPIVATTVGAIPEMLADDCGLLTPPRDADALAAALARVVGDDALRARLGANARARAVAQYGLEAVFSHYQLLWREAAGLETHTHVHG